MKVSQYASGAPAQGTDPIFAGRSSPGVKLTVAEINAFPCNRVFPAAQVPSADPNTLDDYEEGTFTPAVTAGSGSFTTVSGAGRYTKLGDTHFTRTTVTITTNGTAATAIIFTLPFSPTESAAFHGTENATAFTGVHGYGSSGLNTVVVRKYDGTYPGADGYNFVINGYYK